MSRRDYNSSNREENCSDKAVEQSAEKCRQRRRGLQIVPSADQPLIRTPADEELRELIRQIQRPVKKKVVPTDDLPPAA